MEVYMIQYKLENKTKKKIHKNLNFEIMKQYLFKMMKILKEKIDLKTDQNLKFLNQEKFKKDLEGVQNVISADSRPIVLVKMKHGIKFVNFVVLKDKNVVGVFG